MTEKNLKENIEKTTETHKEKPTEELAEEPSPAKKSAATPTKDSAATPRKESAATPTKEFATRASQEGKWAAKFLPDILKNVRFNTLDVQFQGKKADNGIILTPTEVKDKPTLHWTVQKDSRYLIMFVDPDAPTKKNPKLSLYQHWLVGNVPGMELDKGTVLTDYLSAAPPKKSGQHRYVFLVYEQPGEITFTEKKINSNIGKGREKFDLAAFVKQYKLGNPIAGNYFIAEWDSYVITIEKLLGIIHDASAA